MLMIILFGSRAVFTPLKYNLIMFASYVHRRWDFRPLLDAK